MKYVIHILFACWLLTLQTVSVCQECHVPASLPGPCCTEHDDCGEGMHAEDEANDAGIETEHANSHHGFSYISLPPATVSATAVVNGMMPATISECAGFTLAPTPRRKATESQPQLAVLCSLQV